MRILDAGCGSGAQCEWLLDEGADVLGIDLSPAMVGETWQKGGVEVTQHFWRRPLSAVVDAFADAGFVIDRIIEPRPTPRLFVASPGNWRR
jgi:methylase of polypeptide subunit release factors